MTSSRGSGLPVVQYLITTYLSELSWVQDGNASVKQCRDLLIT